MPLASWLFLRGNESIWVERPHHHTMLVAGPGAEREERTFISEEAVQEYQVTLATRLSDEGWFLWGFDRERRQAPDRRSVGRSTGDRRKRAVV